MRTAAYKVPGGKLIRVRFTVRDGMVNDPQISGDFFLMPPERLLDLEQFLIGWKLALPSGEEQLASRLGKFLVRERIELAGVDATTIARVVYLAMEDA